MGTPLGKVSSVILFDIFVVAIIGNNSQLSTIFAILTVVLLQILRI